MGLDVCTTFHMGIAPQEFRQLTEQVVECAAPAYLMAVAGNADPMLGYLTTSFRQHPELRRHTHKQVASAMKNRLIELGVMNESGQADGRGADSLYAAYQRTGGDTRSFDTLRTEANSKVSALAERGFDLGSSGDETSTHPERVPTRIDTIYAHARRALYAKLEHAVIKDVSPRYLRVRTTATDRDDFLAHPPAGEVICREDEPRVRALYGSIRPAVQIVISDGLNANALNENLRLVLPSLRRRLAHAGHQVGDIDVLIENGRVRAGYHVGLLLDVGLVIHLIGERPGTGIDTMSAYLTYGRDQAGQSRWRANFDHSWTTAVCGIHHRGKRPEVAVEEIAGLITEMSEQRCSGVMLRIQPSTS
jgi:ethanolamine ammonia-lyase small subunit